MVHPAGTSSGVPADPSIPTRVLAVPSDLVPILWGRGIAAAEGSVVALTTTQFRVRKEWAHALLLRLGDGALVGVGGRIAVDPGVGTLGRAVHLLRYSEHLVSARSASAADPAGENAAYLRTAILEDCPDLSRGFWEVDAHRRWRLEGRQLADAPEAICDFVPTVSLGDMLLNRFVHGRHFGRYRVAQLGWSRWRAVAVTPLVPVVLLARIAGRVRRAGQPLGPVLTVLPALAALAVAWAAGEAWGALRPGGSDAVGG